MVTWKNIKTTSKNLRKLDENLKEIEQKSVYKFQACLKFEENVQRNIRRNLKN